MSATAPGQTTRPDRAAFRSDQEVRWCPGCGDYAILAQVQKVLAELGIPRERFVVVSGIGCSSRFPYYVNTYGFHSIHGRAPAIATGLRLVRPDLSVWIVTGDGDALSIGGNHLVHLVRRNVDVQILLFNNRIYGLTKGQYSPTSELGKRTRSSPYGSPDRPFQPLQLALGAGATFVARAIDREPAHMAEVLRRAAAHRGTSLVEIYQNCNIFNDGAFALLTDRTQRDEHRLLVRHGEPLRFGTDGRKGIAIEGGRVRVVDIETEGIDAVTVHDERADGAYHAALVAMEGPDLPVPIGVLRAVEAPTYEAELAAQAQRARSATGSRTLHDLLRGPSPWWAGTHAPAVAPRDPL